MSKKSFETIIIHSGAGAAITDAKRLALIRKKIGLILESSFKKLCRSNSLQAVIHAVRMLEDDSEFNAGTGSMLQQDGKARLSASIMNGSNLHFAGIINIEDVKNPIMIASTLLNKKDRVLCGAEAIRYARFAGFKVFDPKTPASIARWKKAKEKGFDTVGACALDRFGNLASATSTGGRGFEMPGRVSDSAMPAGNYANQDCAISATGIGEEIMSEGLAVRLAVRISDGLRIEKSFQKTFREVKNNHHLMGAIGVDRKGRIAAAKTTDSMIFGWKNQMASSICADGRRNGGRAGRS